MRLWIAFLTLLLAGFSSQDLFDELFDMNMGIPDLKPVVCLEGRSDGVGNNSGCFNENESSEEVVTRLAPPVETQPPAGCGYRNVNGVAIFTTTGDESEAQFGEFPWVVAVLKQREIHREIQDIYKCSGSLIHPKVVLTTAHHIQVGRSSEFKVRAGEWEPHRQTEEYPHQERVVSYKIIHPSFNSHNMQFDIGLLVIDRPFDLMLSVNTICLAPAAQLADSSPCFVSGWGIKADSRDVPEVLKKIEVPLRPKRQCERDLRAVLGPRFTLHDSFMCAGGETGKDACFGDGGAPLMCRIANTTNRYYQAGIVSWGLECGRQNVPGVYTNLRYLRSWIDQQMAWRKFQTSFYLTE